MKRTLFTLALVAASVASAASDPIFEDKQGAVLTAGTSYSIDVTSLGYTLESAWTLQFDAEVTGASATWTRVITAGHANQNNLIQMWFNPNTDKVGFDKVGGNIATTEAAASHGDIDLVDGTTHTYTIVFTGGQTAPTMSLYLDNSTTALATREFSYTASNYGPAYGWTFNTLQIGGAGFGAEVSNVALYAGAQAPTGNIPEPTTATLSLLALAGLAARRRRK